MLSQKGEGTIAACPSPIAAAVDAGQHTGRAAPRQQVPSGHQPRLGILFPGDDRWFSDMLN